MSPAIQRPVPTVARRRWSIRAQLVSLVLAVALPAAGLVTYALLETAGEARQAAYAQVQYLAASAASRLQAVVRDNAALLELLARRPRIRAMDPRDCDPILGQLVDLNPQYVSIGLRDRHARILCSSRADPLAPEIVSQFPWFRQGIASARPLVGDAFLHPKTGRWVSVLTHPLTDDSGAVVGLLALSVDLAALQKRLFDALPEGTLVSVLDRRDVFLMRSIGGDAWIGKALPGPQAGRVGGRRVGDTFETTGVDGVTRMYASAKVPSAGWSVFAAQPTDVVLAPHRDRLRHSAAIGISALLLVVALAYGIGSAIARPIAALAKVASTLRSGGAGAAAPAEGATEIDAVAGELVRLADDRERQRGERAALMAHYERLLKSTRDIYLLIDGEGRVADFNDAALQAYGLAPEELRGLPVVELRTPESRATFERDWREVERAGGHLYETVHRRRDGSAFEVEVSSTAIVIGDALYRQSFLRDITDRKAADALLRRQNAELDRFNRAAVGRELDVIELKRRVNELSRELGRDPPYALSFLEPGAAAGETAKP